MRKERFRGFHLTISPIFAQKEWAEWLQSEKMYTAQLIVPLPPCAKTLTQDPEVDRILCILGSANYSRLTLPTIQTT
ncbi:hypothetical protein VTN96DRAFT_8827 [Rasamsonia emersonii]